MVQRHRYLQLLKSYINISIEMENYNIIKTILKPNSCSELHFYVSPVVFIDLGIFFAGGREVYI